MFRLDFRHVVTYLLFGLGFSVVMGFIYMQYVYYDAMMSSLTFHGQPITNHQVGMLMTMEAIFGLIFAIPGGIISDKAKNPVRLLSICLFGITIFIGVFALFPTYEVALATWIACSILMSVWFTSTYKAVRVLADPESIGKSYGMFGAGIAIGSIVVNVLGLALYDHFAVESLTKGFSTIVAVFFTCGLISSIGGYFVAKKLDMQDDINEEKLSLRAFFSTIKDSGTWLFVIALFCIYSVQISVSYFTPYFSSVLGTTVAFSGIIAVLRTYGLRIISAPIGGWLGDKVGSTGKILFVSLAIMTIFFAVVMFLPKATPIAILICIVFIFGLLSTMNVSLQGSLTADAMVPAKHTAVAVCLTDVISADLFQEAMFGNWLDAYGDTAYTYIWIYTIIMAIIAMTAIAIMIKRRSKKEKTTRQNQVTTAVE